MIKIIFEDPYILVLEKPPGLVVDNSETQKGETVETWLASQPPRSHLARLERSGIVHRLDKDTSGLLLVAKTPQALENLKEQFKSRVVKKEYLALVHGLVEKNGRVEGAIGRNPGNREKFTVSLQGDALEARWAMTEYEPEEKFEVQSENLPAGKAGLKVWFPEFNKIQIRKLERMKYGEFTLLRCKPLTGRTHQIRVHLKYIGHPIVSDEKYAGRKMYRLDHRWCPRQFLHAAKIGFNHPVSGEWKEFESKLPEDLEKVLVILNEVKDL